MTEEDNALWQQVARSITPLRQHKLPALAPLKELTVSRTTSAPSSLFLPTAGPASPLVAKNHADIDGRSYESFKKGEMPIDARLDLHGKSHAQAFTAFADFIARCYHSRKRCLLVITGKGRPDADFTLRQAFPAWVNSEALRPVILAFTPATSRHGGSGAFYLLLKRRRTG